MDLNEEIISGLRKQIINHKDCIKDLETEIREIEKDFGKTEHPLQKLIKKYRRVAKLKPPTDEQCETLIDLYGEQKVVETMEAMNNREDISKNHYFNATILNWLRRDWQKKESTGRVIKDNEFRKVMDRAKEESAGQDKIKKGWLTNELNKGV